MTTARMMILFVAHLRMNRRTMRLKTSCSRGMYIIKICILAYFIEVSKIEYRAIKHTCHKCFGLILYSLSPELSNKFHINKYSNCLGSSYVI